MDDAPYIRQTWMEWPDNGQPRELFVTEFANGLLLQLRAGGIDGPHLATITLPSSALRALREFLSQPEMTP